MTEDEARDATDVGDWRTIEYWCDSCKQQEWAIGAVIKITDTDIHYKYMDLGTGGYLQLRLVTGIY